jgi:hypothetical protein
MKLISYIRSLGDVKVEIVTGRASRGPDDMAYHFSKWDQNDLGTTLKEMPADWDNKGKRAGYVRNCDMGDYADVLFQISDGDSKGSKHMLHYMRKLGKPFKSFIVDPEHMDGDFELYNF